MSKPSITQTYRIEIRFDFTGTLEEARAKAHEVAGTLDGGVVTEICDEDWNTV